MALALAPARAADLPIGAIAAAYKTGLGGACGGVLYPPSVELEAAATACWGAIDATADAPPTECPSGECRAFAKGMGRQCWFEFFLATNALRSALATSLEGGKALSSAEVAKMQKVSDALTAKDPAAGGDVAAALEIGDAEFAAGLKAGNATAAATIRKEAAYAAALEAACRPDLAPAPPAAPAASADAGDAPIYEESVAAIYKDKLPACKDVLFPASAEFKTAQISCAGGAFWEIPTECSAACLAAAPLWGADCLAEYYQRIGGVIAATSAALAGGPAMPAADVAKLQAWSDLTARVAPSTWAPLDWAATLESGETAYAAVIGQYAKVYKAQATVCAAAAGGAAAAAAEAVSGARAPAAAAAALLALLAI
jgi:hypothetical protein